jgi:poly(A) polymerase
VLSYSKFIYSKFEDAKIIKLLKGLIKNIKKTKPSPKNTIEPTLIPRAEHTISRQDIHPNALKVLYRLHSGGYGAYLVGGCVRDLLLGYHPKDFDIATNATPDEVRRLFKNCRLIGKRFRLAHIVFGRDIIEVATFRTHHENAEEQQHARMEKGMIIRDNVYGTIEDDVCRRDFTINALYYNIADFTVVDYTHAMQDIHDRVLRIIGDPEKRFHEDPVRLIRAIRFAGKLNLTIHIDTEAHIPKLSYLLANVSSARLFQEILKLFEGGALLNTFKLLEKYNLLEQLFPLTAESFKHPVAAKLIETSLLNTDQRVDAEKSVSPAFLFAVCLWHPIQAMAKREEANGLPVYVAHEKAIQIVLKKQTERLAIPRQLQVSIRDICFLQHRFLQRHGVRPFRVFEHPRFRAAYDLLFLRTEAGEDTKALLNWWTEFQTATLERREQLIKEVSHSRPGKKRRKPRKFQKNKAVIKSD